METDYWTKLNNTKFDSYGGLYYEALNYKWLYSHRTAPVIDYNL